MHLQRGEHRRHFAGPLQAPRVAARSSHSNAQQINEECYGDEPHSARGHMTRREDPIWGPEAAAALGNSDSMHVTNTVPQMQPFNAGIWLGLEDYALDHARADDMRISVFTGPFLFATIRCATACRYRARSGRSLRSFTMRRGELSATGYTMAQDSFPRAGRVCVLPAHDVAGAHRRHRLARRPLIRPPRVGSIPSEATRKGQ